MYNVFIIYIYIYMYMTVIIEGRAGVARTNKSRDRRSSWDRGSAYNILCIYIYMYI